MAQVWSLSSSGSLESIGVHPEQHGATPATHQHPNLDLNVHSGIIHNSQTQLMKVSSHNRRVFTCEKERSTDTCYHMDRPWCHYPESHRRPMGCLDLLIGSVLLKTFWLLWLLYLASGSNANEGMLAHYCFVASSTTRWPGEEKRGGGGRVPVPSQAPWELREGYICTTSFWLVNCGREGPLTGHTLTCTAFWHQASPSQGPGGMGRFWGPLWPATWNSQKIQVGFL